MHTHIVFCYMRSRGTTERSQLRWFGHLTVMSPGRFFCKVFQACTPGRRPRTSWKDNISLLVCDRSPTPRSWRMWWARRRSLLRVVWIDTKWILLEKQDFIGKLFPIEEMTTWMSLVSKCWKKWDLIVRFSHWIIKTNKQKQKVKNNQGTSTCLCYFTS